MGREQYRKISRGVRVRIYASGQEVYQLQFSYKGLPCKEQLKIPVSKANDRYAANVKAEIENSIQRQTFNYSDYFPNSNKAAIFGHAISKATVSQLLDQWIQDISRSHPHSTHRAYKKSVNRLKTSLGAYRAIDLSKNATPIKDFIRSRNVTLKTIRNDLTPLRAIFDQELIENRIPQNPMDKIKVAKLVNRDNKSGYKVDPYGSDEIMAILESANQHRPEWKPYWQFVFFTGLRTSEGYALQWTKIDWQQKQAMIDCAVVERHLKEVKTTASEDIIPLLPMAEQALIDQRSKTQAWSDYVFINPKTNAPIIDYEETATVLKYLCKKSGIRYRMQRQTRHSFASNLLSGGENPYHVAKLLRHKNVEMVFKVYGKWLEQGKKQEQKLYTSEFANLNKKSTIKARNKVV